MNPTSAKTSETEIRSSGKRLPAEWEPQDAVLLTWPHEESDWAPLLERAHQTYLDIAKAILRYTNLIVVASPSLASSLLKTLSELAVTNKVAVLSCPSDDTWTRDHGPLCVRDNESALIMDFVFNGWGNKFSATQDNAITAALFKAGIFRGRHQASDFVLEGGAIESDGAGTILTTSACLLNPNRNPVMTQVEIEATLRETLGAQHILWLDHGHLIGDDTDSHVDTLARLAPGDQILYVTCDDAADEHFTELKHLEAELLALRTQNDEKFRLIPLPWPSAKFAADGHRLPATYANFLITNQAVLVPTYDDAKDRIALAQVGQAFPQHEIVGINCNALIEQHGSLHCITMQIPQGFLNHTIFTSP